MSNRRVFAAAVCLAGGWISAGCSTDPAKGYTLASQYRRNVRSVAVPIWKRGKGEYRRDLEGALTEAIQKQIQAEAGYRILTAKKADTLLTGTLREVEKLVMSFDSRTGKAREIQVRMLVDFTWRDLRTGEVLVSKKEFPVVSSYVVPEPFGEDFFMGSTDVFDRAARRIVEQLAEPW